MVAVRPMAEEVDRAGRRIDAHPVKAIELDQILQRKNPGPRRAGHRRHGAIDATEEDCADCDRQESDSCCHECPPDSDQAPCSFLYYYIIIDGRSRESLMGSDRLAI